MPRGWADHPERPLLGVIVALNAWAWRGVLRAVSWPNDLAMHDAIARELELATEARRREAQAGAARFAAGAGRHGEVTPAGRAEPT